MHSYAHHNHESGETATGETRGLIMNWGWRYDLMVWFFDTIAFRGGLKKLQRNTGAPMPRREGCACTTRLRPVRLAS